MKNFDIKRFSRTMMWNLRASRKGFLAKMMVTFFVFLLFFSVSILDNIDSPEKIRLESLHSTVRLCCYVMFIFVLVCGNGIFNNMKTKQQRIMFKMLPASCLEKFLVRYLYVLALWVIGIFAAFCLADMTRILICEIAGVGWCYSGISMFLNELSGNFIYCSEDGDLPQFSAAGGFWALWVHSTYVLGGVFFCRRQFIFTSLFHFVLGMAVLWTVSNFIYGENKVEVMIAVEQVPPVFSGIFAVLTVLDYWLSFHLFKRMQVVNNKCVNV